MSQRIERILVIVSLLTSIGVWAGVLFFQALWLRVDYFDAYQILCNTRTLFGDRVSGYFSERFFLPSLLYSVFNFFNPSTERLWQSAHVMTFSISVAAGLVFYRLLRTDFSRVSSLFGVVFLIWNPIFLHYSIFVKEDLLALLGVLIVFIAIRRNHSILLTAGLLLALGSRYNLVPAFALFFAARAVLLRRFEFGAICSAFFLFWFLGDWTFHQSGVTDRTFFSSLLTQYRLNQGVYKPGSVFFSFFRPLVGIPTLMVSAFGLYLFFRRTNNANYLLWISVFMLLHAFIIPGKEIRYLLAILPMLILGLVEVMERIANHRRTVFLVALLFPYQGVFEMRHLSQEFYRRSPVESLATRLAPIAKDHRIYWVGPFAATAPSDFRVAEADDFFRVFHFYSHSLEFFMRKKVHVIYPAPESLSHLRVQFMPGDVVIHNPNRRSFVTSNLPPEPLSLEFYFVNSSRQLEKLPLFWPLGPIPLT